MTPTMFARLKAASAYVMAEVNKNTIASEILAGLVAQHHATYRVNCDPYLLRCAGVTATCTSSRDEGLLNAWRRLATVKIAMEQQK